MSPPLDLTEIEEAARKEGNIHIVGVDEVGRGPLAGPVVAAAVKLPEGCRIEGLADSKSLSSRKRELISNKILKIPNMHYGLGLVSSQIIDRVNVLQATHLAMRKAIQKIQTSIDIILVDGNPVPGFPYPSKNVIKGDKRVASIAAASIIAKVYRDQLMKKFDALYPGYGFRKNKGYGTKEHINALQRLGACPIHRYSFAPVSKCM